MSLQPPDWMVISSPEYKNACVNRKYAEEKLSRIDFVGDKRPFIAIKCENLEVKFFKKNINASDFFNVSNGYISKSVSQVSSCHGWMIFRGEKVTDEMIAITKKKFLTFKGNVPIKCRLLKNGIIVELYDNKTSLYKSAKLVYGSLEDERKERVFKKTGYTLEFI